MNDIYQPSRGYQLSPSANYIPTRQQMHYQNSSPRYEQVMREYQNLSSQLTKQMQGSYE